jgi:hypothetical protein
MGGTAVDSTSKGPLLAVVALLLVGAGVIAYFAMSGSDAPSAAPVAGPATDTTDTTATDTTDTAGPDQPDTVRTNEPATPDPGAVADRLERALKRERLWSTVSIEGTRVDVRSGSCGDPQLAGIVDGSAAALKAAGLTRVRCLEQSGRVVTDRDL